MSAQILQFPWLDAPPPGERDFPGYGWVSDGSGDTKSAPEVAVRDPFKLIALADLPDVTLRPEDRLWWDGILIGHVTVLVGHSNVGKTTLLRNIIRAVSMGELFLGWSGPTGGAGVVVLDYETPAIDRTTKWRAIYGDGFREVRNVIVACETPLLDEVVSVEVVIAMLRRHGARLLVVDTLSRAFAVESENDNAEMSGVMAQLKRIADAGFAVVVVAHFAKAAGVGIHALRGASSIAAAADVVVGLFEAEGKGRRQERKHSVAADAESDVDKPYVLEIFKNRTAGQGMMRIFRDGHGGFRAAAAAETADTRAKSHRVMDDIVAAAGERGLSTKEAIDLAADHGVAVRTAKGALKSLSDGGVIDHRHGHYIYRGGCREGRP